MLCDYLEKYCENKNLQQQETLLSSLLSTIMQDINTQKQTVFLKILRGEDITNSVVELPVALPEVIYDSEGFSSPFSFRNICKSVMSYAIDYAKNQLSILTEQSANPKNEKEQTSDEFLASFIKAVMSLKFQDLKFEAIIILSKLFDEVVKHKEELHTQTHVDDLKNIVLKIKSYQQLDITETQHQLKTLIVVIVDKASKLYSTKFLLNIVDEFTYLLHASDSQYFNDSVVLIKQLAQSEYITSDDINILQNNLVGLRLVATDDSAQSSEQHENEATISGDNFPKIIATEASLGGELTNEIED
jgi:hypothetical protein